MGQRARVIVVMSCRAELDRLSGHRWAESRSAGYDAHDGNSCGASMRKQTFGPGGPAHGHIHARHISPGWLVSGRAHVRDMSTGGCATSRWHRAKQGLNDGGVCGRRHAARA